MPWSRTSPMDQKIRFIADHQRQFFSLPELCGRFGISRSLDNLGCIVGPELAR